MFLQMLSGSLWKSSWQNFRAFDLSKTLHMDFKELVMSNTISVLLLEELTANLVRL